MKINLKNTCKLTVRLLLFHIFSEIEFVVMYCGHMCTTTLTSQHTHTHTPTNRFEFNFGVLTNVNCVPKENLSLK